MAIYKIEGNNKKLTKLDTTSLGKEDVWERDLQRMLLDQPEVLEEGLLIIAEEFGNWEDSKRRIDLLGLDADGNLVVVELKRGYTGEHMDLQAMRYAAMVANMTYPQAVDTYQAHLEKRAKEEGVGDEPDDVERRLRERLPSNEQGEPVIHTEIPRIILASEDFGKELTTCVMWLNDSWLRDAGQEIKCVRLQPHRNGAEVLIEASVVIPLPESSDYQTQLGQRKQETRSESSGKVQIIQGAEAFLESIERASEQFQPGLKSLRDTALRMEQEEVAELYTRTNTKDDNCSIDLTVPGKGQSLVSFTNLLLYKDRECGGEIAFWPAWGDLAPKTLPRIEELIKATTSQKRFRRLSRINDSDLDAMLATIRNAYREASGHQTEVASPDD